MVVDAESACAQHWSFQNNLQVFQLIQNFISFISSKFYLIYSPRSKYSIIFLPLRICNTLTFKSYSAPRGFSLGTSGFLLSSKTNIWFIWFDLCCVKLIWFDLLWFKKGIPSIGITFGIFCSLHWWTNFWIATNPWRSKQTMVWQTCWMTKQNVLSSNMAATPLSLDLQGLVANQE